MLRQWEQDYIHELIDRDFSMEAILREMPKLGQGRFAAVAARYRAFLTGESPTPYLDGTRVYGDPESLELKPVKRESGRFWGETNGEQVF
jgi:hypothetical protein